MAFLTNIQTNLVSALNSMTVSGGYTYTTGQTQQDDLAKVNSWPLYNVYLAPGEVSLNSRSFPDMNSYRNAARFQIHGFNKLATESANSQFDIDNVLNDMLDDLKRVIHRNYTLGGIVEGLFYVRSTRVPSGKSDDIFLPYKLIFEIEVIYSQDADSLSINGGC